MQKFIVNQDGDEAIELKGVVTLLPLTKKRKIHQIALYDGYEWICLGSYQSEKMAKAAFSCVLGFIAQNSSSNQYVIRPMPPSLFRYQINASALYGIRNRLRYGIATVW